MKSDPQKQKCYICIDLKSFYASVECVERGLDPMTTNLVVADPERSDKTICLAVSPSMKALGVRNRCRVFEIPENIRYVMAPPRMQKYIDYAAEIYGVYLKYFSKDDIHVYSIDEAFIDVTPYLSTYKMTPRELAVTVMDSITKEVGVRATCGIGTNLYLAKIALDITAKHSPDFIGELDEESYRRTLWEHRPITDFWRIGKGTARRLEKLGLRTMGEVAQYNEDILYDRFGIDAELLIDHAWGREPVTIADIKAYRPKDHSLTSGQVLMRDYSFEEGRLILREMIEQLCLDMVSKGLLTQSMSVWVRYSNKSGIPPASGTASVDKPTSSLTVLTEAAMDLYERMMDREVPIRGFMLSCNSLTDDDGAEQISFFDDAVRETKESDRKIQQTMLDIKEKFGKNAIFRSADLKDEATTLERNRQIGGHKSGE